MIDLHGIGECCLKKGCTTWRKSKIKLSRDSSGYEKLQLHRVGVGSIFVLGDEEKVAFGMAHLRFRNSFQNLISLILENEDVIIITLVWRGISTHVCSLK